jgi:hypothetical protein
MSASNLRTTPLFRTSLRAWQANWKANQESTPPEQAGEANNLRLQRVRRRSRKSQAVRSQG